jgi:isoleucyl-tRNA synthetase
MFKPVDPKQSFPEMEENILKFWEESKIFEKSLELRKDAELYSFYDGPPFATGTPHYGHIVGSVMKDVVPRYWTMRGFNVPRKWGWDCHGLPIENIAEKELGVRRKKEILEKYGVERFNEICRSKVLEYVASWKKVIHRLGRWADMENAYKTMDLSFMESVWWVFKQLWDKGLVYESYRSMHICPRCETTLSQSEVAEGYKMIKDLSVVAKFKLKYMPGRTGRGVGALIINDKKEFLLAHRNEKGRRITWALAGGKLDERESFLDALKREVKEELGVDIVSARAFTRRPSILEGRLFETMVFEVKIEGEPQIMVPEEMDKLGWFSLDNLPEIDYPPSRDAVELYKKNLGNVVDEEISLPLPEVYLLAWTTTPWTLIGNVALAVGEKIKYILIKCGDKYFITAKDKIEEIFSDKDYEIIGDVDGKELVGLSYKPVFDYYVTDENLANRENGWKIYPADFVTTEEGTGIVHIAPAFGEDDMNLGKEYNLPFVSHVDMDGTIRPEATDFAGLDVKPIEDSQKTDVEIIKYLAKKNLLFAKKQYEHSYPHCWRCDTPLLNYATTSWFVSIEKIKEKMLEQAKDINWSPEHIKDGRFGKWLEGARDWSISRQRFWASVIPIWKCECGEMKVFGSVKELEDISGEKITDLHKHIVDKITFKCEKCGGEMKRIPDVLDTWFDSGSMPYAQAHYPFENKESFEKSFPANFIAEGVDQTRAWFYYLHAISTAIQDSKAYKNVIVNGIVLAEDGKKMSKRLKNYPDPAEMMQKYGADALRYYLMDSPVVAAENLAFSEKDMSENVRGMLRMLWNTYSFFVLYANIDKFEAKSGKYQVPEDANLLDRWLVSELNSLIKNVNHHMENYELNKTARLFPQFIDNLSNWYIRRSRKRFWKSENDEDKDQAYDTLHYVLVELSRLMAPFTPFVSEEIYKNLAPTPPQSSPQAGEEAVVSVHLADFPTADEKLIDDDLNEKMQLTRRFVKLGLAARARVGIKVRQPLSELKINEDVGSDLGELIKEEVNVKKISFSGGVADEPGFIRVEEINWEVGLNTAISDDLRLEGEARELIRRIQELRKKAGYQVDNRIILSYTGGSAIFAKFRDLIAKETLAEQIVPDEDGKADISELVELDREPVKVWLRKI